MQAARQRQETAEFKAQYALRAGVESTLSQGVRRFDLRRSRYIGLARTHLQQTLNATAMNIVRVLDWLKGRSGGAPRRQEGHFARLTPNLGSSRAQPVQERINQQSLLWRGLISCSAVSVQCDVDTLSFRLAISPPASLNSRAAHLLKLRSSFKFHSSNACTRAASANSPRRSYVRQCIPFGFGYCHTG